MRTNNDRDRTNLVSRFSQFCEHAHKFTLFCKQPGPYRVVQYKFTDVSREVLPPSTVHAREHSILYSYSKQCRLRKQLFGMPKKKNRHCVGKSRICWMLEHRYIQVSLGATEHKVKNLRGNPTSLHALLIAAR